MSFRYTKDQTITLDELRESSNRHWRMIGTYHNMPVVSNGLDMFALTPKRVDGDRKPGRLRVIAGSAIKEFQNGNV